MYKKVYSAKPRQESSIQSKEYFNKPEQLPKGEKWDIHKYSGRAALLPKLKKLDKRFKFLDKMFNQK